MNGCLDLWIRKFTTYLQSLLIIAFYGSCRKVWNSPELPNHSVLKSCGCLTMDAQKWLKPSGHLKIVQIQTQEQFRKIEKGGKELKHWSRVHFRNVRSELNLKMRLLVVAEKEAMQFGDNACVRSLKAKINDLLDKESQMWL